MDFANYDLNGLLASISTENSCDWTLKYTLDENYDELREVYSSTNPNDPFSSQHKTCEETSSLSDQLNGTIEAYLDPDSSMNDNLISKTSLFGEWCGENSSFDSLGQQFASEIMAQEVVDVCTSFDSSIVHDSAFVSLDKGSSFQDNHSSEPVVVTDVVLPSSSIEPVDMSEEFLKLSSLDDLCQWFAPSTDDSICTTMIQLDNNLPESIEFNPTLAEHNTITTTVNSEMKETSVLIHSSENDFLDNLELDLGCDQSSEWWGNLLTPMVSTATDIGFSECISELNYTTTLTDNRKRLFSELGGIEELLKGQANYNNPFNSSNFENELLSSNKRQMVEFSSMSRTQVNFASLVGAEAGPNLMQSVSDLEKSNSVLTKKDTFPKLQVGMLINDRNSINMKRGVSLHPKKQEEPTKPTKKKAKPGESTRPRPKDRQQIQDCIKELRGIIPHGGKCSIDSLLDRTIRYMLFLRSVIKYADMIHEPNEPKLIEQANGVVPKDSENRGATWAFEVGNQTMVCPIIVEDMNPPGQMLIEMLCEDQGFFLEIVDIIKGFGLNILKAKMEIKKSKLWGRFIVEANRHVTRIDVFWSLIHLLQQPNITGSDSSNKHSNVIDANIA